MKTKVLPGTELISRFFIVAIEASPESNKKLVTIADDTVDLSDAALPPIQTLLLTPVVPVSTTASVGIIYTKSTMDIDTEMATSTYKTTSNRFNYYIISSQETPPLPFFVVPKGQNTPSYNECMNIPKMITLW